MARGKSSGNFSLTRSTLLVDIQQQKDREASEAKQAAAEAKAAKTEAWNALTDKLKQLAQNVYDGTSTAQEYAAAIKDASSQFSDKAGLLESNLRSVVRSADTQRFNDYVSGALTYKDFKNYVDERNSDKSGDLDHLSQLMSKAQKNEDTVQYNSYIKGETSINDWNKYTQSRADDKGSEVGVHLATLDAQAQANEARANDKRYQVAYQAGTLPADDYQKYLDSRLNGATNPNDLNALRIEKQSVEKNEFVKQVNQILDGAQSGRFSPGDAALQLHAMLNKTNDATLQGQVLNHIASLKSAANAGAASVSAALRAKQTAVNENYTAAKSEFDSAMTKINSAAGKGADPAQLLAQAGAAWAKFATDIEFAAKNSTDETRQTFFQGRLENLDRERSASLSEIVQTAAQAKGDTTGKNTNPLSGAGSRAEVLLRSLADSLITPEDKSTIYSQAMKVLGDATKEWTQSQDGRNAESFIQDRALDVMGAGASAQKALQAQANALGLGPIDFGSRDSVGNALRVLISQDPTAVWKTLSDNNVKGFNVDASSDEFNKSDTFTRDWNSVSGGAVGLQAITKTIYGTKDRAGLSLADRANFEVNSPGTLASLESNANAKISPDAIARNRDEILGKSSPAGQEAQGGDKGPLKVQTPGETGQETPEVQLTAPGESVGVAGQEKIGNVSQAPPFYGEFPGQDANPAEMHPGEEIGPQPSPDAQDRNEATLAEPSYQVQTPGETGQDISQLGIQEPVTPQTTSIIPTADINSGSNTLDPGAEIPESTIQPELPDQDTQGGGGRRE